MKLYRILETETTKDFCGSLIEMICQGAKKDEYMELYTCDGKLLFKEDEIEEVERPKIIIQNKIK